MLFRSLVEEASVRYELHEDQIHDLDETEPWVRELIAAGKLEQVDTEAAATLPPERATIRTPKPRRK